MQTNIKEYDESFNLTQALQKKGTKEKSSNLSLKDESLSDVSDIS